DKCPLHLFLTLILWNRSEETYAQHFETVCFWSQHDLLNLQTFCGARLLLLAKSPGLWSTIVAPCLSGPCT
ncbi:hypothetical protein BKA70DRAFT_1283659, partial [Coprinopsis sp. MPI-PUGE-AT-0042]